MERSRNFFSATRIAMIALFATLSGILYAFGFPINVAFPFWLELNFSDIPALIGTFTLGPLSGALIIVVKIMIKLLIKPSGTMFVGELADLLIGCAFVVPAGLIYKKKRTMKGAIAAMAVGTAASVVVAMLANWLVLVPYYLAAYFGGDWTPLVGGMQVLFPSCTQQTFYAFYIWCSVLPFNVMRCAIAILVTLLVYKHISRAINKFSERITPKNDEDGAKAKKINIGAIVAFAVVVALVVLFALLRFFVWKG